MGTAQQPQRRRRFGAALIAAISIQGVTVGFSQAQDALPADSTAISADSTASTWSDPFLVSLAQRIPARVYSFELTEMLKETPVSFLYDLGPHGWPHGYSAGGISPQHVGLLWNGLSMNDPFTGRPQYDLLPLNSGEVPHTGFGYGSRPVSINLSTRPAYQEIGQPLTELSYHTSKDGLQHVYGLHSQNRRLDLRGKPGRLNVLFSYGGEAADGEYPGSRVKQGRQIYSRLKLLRSNWSLELGDLYNKRAVGAHGGVIPRVAGDFDSIYQRLGASVVDADAQREATRNDVFATLQIDPGGRGRSVTTVMAGYTSQRSEYLRSDDTLTVLATRAHFRFSHAEVRSTYRLSADAEGSTSRAKPRSAALDFADETDSRLIATGSAEFHIGAETGTE